MPDRGNKKKSKSGTVLANEGGRKRLKAVRLITINAPSIARATTLVSTSWGWLEKKLPRCNKQEVSPPLLMTTLVSDITGHSGEGRVFA